MHTVFGFEIAKGVTPYDLERGTFETRFFTRLEVQDFVGIAMRLSPTDIHAQEHMRPILRLGAPGPGVDGQQGIRRIHLPAQQ